jgi:hypothetical protein
MFWLVRGAVVIGVIFYLSPLRHASHAPDPLALDRATAADAKRQVDAWRDVVGRFTETLLRADRDGAGPAGLAPRPRLPSAADAEVTAAARRLRLGDEQLSAGDPASRHAQRREAHP